MPKLGFMRNDMFKAAPSTSDKTAEAGVGYLKDDEFRSLGISGGPEKQIRKKLSYEIMRQLHELSDLVRAATDGIETEVTAVDPIMEAMAVDGADEPTDEAKKHRDTVDDFLLKNPNTNRESYYQLRKRVTNNILVYDAGALNVRRGTTADKLYRDPETKELLPMSLHALPGDTIRIMKNQYDEFVNPDKAYQQVENGRRLADFSIDQMIYFMMNPRAGYLYGMSPLETLYITVGAELEMNRINSDRVTNNATPQYAVIYKNTSMPLLRRYSSFLQQQMRSHPDRPLLFSARPGADVNIQKLGMSNQEMEWVKLTEWLLKKVMMVYKVPPIVLGLVDRSVGKLNSEKQYEQFKKAVLKPMLRMWAYQINMGLIWAKGNFNFPDVMHTWESIDLVDEERSSKIALILSKIGTFRVREIREAAGYEPLGEDHKELDDSIYKPQVATAPGDPGVEQEDGKTYITNLETLEKYINREIYDRTLTEAGVA